MYIGGWHVVDHPIFSIIVCTMDRKKELNHCLTSLVRARSRSDFSVEIIVSDDGVIQLDAGFISQFTRVHWIRGPRKGRAANCNRAVSRSKGKWLVFIDDDCVVDPDIFLAYHRAILTYPDVFFFDGCVVPNRKRNSFRDVAPVKLKSGLYYGCNTVVSRHLFKKVDGFDERYVHYGMEDIDFAVRVMKKGYSTHFVKDAIVCHPWRNREGRMQAKQYAMSWRLFHSIHRGTPYGKNRLRRFFAIMYCFFVSTFTEGPRFSWKGYWLELIWLYERLKKVW